MIKRAIVTACVLFASVAKAEPVEPQVWHLVEVIQLSDSDGNAASFACMPLVQGPGYFVANCILTQTKPSPDPKAAAAGEVVVIETRLGCQKHGNNPDFAECEEQITEGTPAEFKFSVETCGDGRNEKITLTSVSYATLAETCPQ